jgi:Leucine-rich repeat (LRR) protein
MKKTVSTISPILELKHKWDVVLELGLIVAILSAVPTTLAQATLEGINSTLAQEVVTKQATTPAPPTQPPIPSQWLTHQALTSVPPSPANASVIQLYYLDYNSITSINPQTDFANYSRLYGLFITNNYLTELPCLPNVKTTLSQLYLSNNLISYISAACLSLLQYLSSLILYNNRISHLPDVYMANIYNIGLYTNAFTTFPTLPTLGKLQTLWSTGRKGKLYIVLKWYDMQIEVCKQECFA